MASETDECCVSLRRANSQQSKAWAMQDRERFFRGGVNFPGNNVFGVLFFKFAQSLYVVQCNVRSRGSAGSCCCALERSLLVTAQSRRGCVRVSAFRLQCPRSVNSGLETPPGRCLAWLASSGSNASGRAGIPGLGY